MNLIQVSGELNLYRDENSTAIINTDKNAYQSYMEARNRKLQELNEIQSLKNDVEELKSLMHQILQKL
jgi:hypothetical protein